MKGPPAAEPHNHLARPSARLERPHVGNAMSVGMSSGGADPQRGGPAEVAGLERRRPSLAEFLGEA